MALYVARDKEGDLYLYDGKPIRNTLLPTWTGGLVLRSMYLDYHLFKDLKWEDEPIEVELKLVSNKVDKGSKYLTFKEIEQLIDDLI